MARAEHGPQMLVAWHEVYKNFVGSKADMHSRLRTELVFGAHHWRTWTPKSCDNASLAFLQIEGKPSSLKAMMNLLKGALNSSR